MRYKDYLTRESLAALERRDAAYDQMKSEADCAAYQERLRGFFARQLGGWPERTPLNAQVVAELAGDGFRIEKIIYESQPKFFVSALMFLPSSAPPYPAVLVPCGHSENGKAFESYQKVCIFLARNGIAALIYDPVGQGERYQTLTDEGKGNVGGVVEHTMLGAAAILVGMNTASFRIWDGMRGIDYLIARGDVDPERIGCTGNSGGGTLTSYLMALDPRIKASAVSCYLTSFKRLIETIGPQDAEQNIFGQIAFGMDHADYLILHAPQPALVCCATRDFFDVPGTWDTYRGAKRLYSRLGINERLDIVEADTEHGYLETQRTAMVRWMRRWLLGVDDAVTEQPCTVLSDAEAQVTPKGQVLLLEGARSAWDILADREAQLAADRKHIWTDAPRDKALEAVRVIAGIRALANLPEPEVVAAGSVSREGYRIDKVVLKTEAGILLPGLLLEGAQTSGDACLYLFDSAEEKKKAIDDPLAELAKQGHRVFVADVRGTGETAPDTKGWEPYVGPEWRDFFHAYLLGKSYVGMRAEDVLVAARFLAGYRVQSGPRPVHLVAVGEVAIPALHAAALEPGLFAEAQFDRMVTSWSGVVRTPLSRHQLVNAVHGALSVYDLPDLIALLPKNNVRVTNPVTPDGQPAR